MCQRTSRRKDAHLIALPREKGELQDSKITALDSMVYFFSSSFLLGVLSIVCVHLNAELYCTAARQFKCQIAPIWNIIGRTSHNSMAAEFLGAENSSSLHFNLIRAHTIYF